MKNEAFLKEFGFRVRNLRLNYPPKGMSQEELGAELKVSRQTISKWETGKCMPDYSIVNGGAQIVDKNGKNIFLKPIEHQYVSAIVADIESVSKFAAVQTLDNLYTDSDKFLKQHPIRFDFKNEFPYDAYKILCDINQDIDAFKIAKKHHLDYVSYYDSTYKVFRHFDTGKDKGMLNLLKMLKRDVKDVISFGDDAGDIEMLKISNIGVIMKNANPKYFENNLTVSEYSNDEDGVARFLVKYFNLII